MFRALLTGNPNYFGNVANSSLQPIVPKQGDTTFEEIGCVGFHPQAHRLDAVVFVKQPFGYSGDICSNGSQECVRFYLSFDNGTTWIDQGASSFTVYDVPQNAELHRLEYATGRSLFAAREVLSVQQRDPRARDLVVGSLPASQPAELDPGLGRSAQHAHPGPAAPPAPVVGTAQ